MITVDAGDLPGWRPDRARHRALFGVIRQLGYDALGLGDGEFVDGAEALAAAVRTHDLPAVNANIHVPSLSEWRRLIPPYRLIRAGALRVGVIGVASRQAFELMLPDRMAGLRIDAAETTLRRLVPVVRKQSDIVMVLSHAGFKANREMARRVPGIDVIVGSHGVTALHEPVLEGRTLIVQAGDNGAYVGQLNLTVDRRRITEFGGRLIPLTADIPDDSGVRRLLDAYEEDMRLEAAQAARRPSDAPPYRGEEDCRPCHEAQYRQWRTTAHARAYQSLEDHGAARVPECLSCHTTGYGRPTGFLDPETTPSLTNVQCEDCHRVSVRHGHDADDTAVPPVRAATCAGCHTPDRSPAFLYDAAIRSVRH